MGGRDGVGGMRTYTFTVTDNAIIGATCKIGFTMAQQWALPQNWKANPQKHFIIQI